MIAAVRPLLRIELRQACRHLGRSSLVVALIAVPVAALVGGSTLVRALERPTGESIAPAVFVLGSLGFVEAALVIAAAFAVGLRRRRREVGLLAATGADPRAVLAAILGLAGLLALIGGVVGTGLGLGIAAALLPHVEGWLGRPVAEFAVPGPQLAGALALGVAAALLSAWWPARAALRSPVRAALAGRRPPLGATAPWTRTGFALLALGVAGVGFGSAREEWLGAIANVLGSACFVLGLGACCPWLLEHLARHAARLPLAWRLAAREAGRLRHRDGPVVAAILAAMAVSVTASSLCASVAAADAALAPAADPNPGPGLLACAVLLLAVTAGVTVLLAANALTAVEAAGERCTFAAVGAPPEVVRRFAGARAAVLGLLGCSLAVPAGLLTALGITAADAGLDFVVPWGGLIAAWLALPSLAYFVAWGAAPPLSARR